MKRIELIEQLAQVQENIETVEKQLSQKMPAYYAMFSRVHRWNDLFKVRTKALSYWKRRFNRIILQLGYKL